ncbi:hypothetical protein TanjilG_11878 [Lupinus angustifolius]|uniref:Uncharacterized protein n=1 Tax=Lupinus angustifolius TaxID=3871 RepID=A0A394DB51_LUPAN|nr:PREDICTED: plant intracellular Ras-group-related LRR protein 6-like [Lupinus angustifolius]OIW20475.1 hypothetical protein TanjilG_11878 [Lupinus angustifolius]
MYELQQHMQPRMKRGMRRKKERSKSFDFEEEKLQIMNFNNMSLESLPTFSTDLAIICKLDLSNNNLQNIPESLTARLLNLLVLDLHSNQMRFLPNSIGCLSKLKVLNVSANFIESLPKTIENCRSLEELNCNFNKLSELPDTIGFELINLKKLLVNSNKLMFLPSSTSNLVSLKILDARLNCLRSLPEDLENLINLEALNVSQNFRYLETLPFSVGLLLSLVELDVSYNNIKTLPNSIGCFKKLQKLRVEGNPLISPPLEVVEQGLHVVKEYLCEKINSSHESKHKNMSWVRKLVKCEKFNGYMRSKKQPQHEDDDFNLHQYHTASRLSTQSLVLGVFSPKRFFSHHRSSSFG